MTSKEFLFDIKEMFEHGKYHSTKDSKLDLKLAIHHSHFAIEQIIRENAKDLQFKDNLKGIGFKEVIKKLHANQNIPEYTRILELNTLRNNIQHHNFIPNKDTIKIYIKVSEEFLIWAYKQYFNIDYNNVFLEELLNNTQIKEHLLKAKEAIRTENISDAISNIDHAIAKFKSILLGYFFEPNATMIGFGNITLADLLSNICLKIIFGDDTKTLQKLSEINCTITQTNNGFKIDYITPNRQNKTIEEVKKDYSEILNIILNYQYKYEIISESNIISWQK